MGATAGVDALEKSSCPCLKSKDDWEFSTMNWVTRSNRYLLLLLLLLLLLGHSGLACFQRVRISGQARIPKIKTKSV